jgi:hypothetical protein
VTALYNCPKCGCAMEPPTVETMDVRLTQARATAARMAGLLRELVNNGGIMARMTEEQKIRVGAALAEYEKET